MRIRGLVLPLIAVLIFGGAAPTRASRPDSWEGHLFLRDVTDLLAFPHRALEDRDMAVGTHVPSPSPAVLRAVGAGENSMDVSGLISLGLGDRVGLFVSANDPRGYNPTAGFVVQGVRAPGGALAGGGFAMLHQTQGITTPGAAPDEMAQLGVAFGVTNELAVGAFGALGKYETKGALTTDMGPTIASGRSTDYFDITGSAGWQLDAAFLEKVEASFSYASGSQEELGATPISGTGDNSSLGAAAFVHFDATLWGWRPIVTGGWAKVESDFTYYQDPSVATPVPSVDEEETAIHAAVGGTRALGNGGTVAISVGMLRRTDKFAGVGVAGFDKLVIDETTTLNPVLDFAVDIPLFRKLTLASGVDYEFGSLEGDTNQTVGATRTHFNEESEDLSAKWSAGLVYDVNGHVQVSVTMHDDAWTSNPVRGDSEDDWVSVLRAQYAF